MQSTFLLFSHIKLLKKNYQIFISVNVSKSKLDHCIVTDSTAIKDQFGIISNNEEGIKQLNTLVKKIDGDSLVALYVSRTQEYIVYHLLLAPGSKRKLLDRRCSLN